IACLAATWRSGIRAHTAGAFVGAFAIVGAAFNGASFVNYGHDASSLVMAALWAIALTSYVLCLYVVARRLTLPAHDELHPPPLR
ncbi:MAG TPA: hypothetical protein VGQ83_08445, partial [Polyangia bacterium]